MQGRGRLKHAASFVVAFGEKPILTRSSTACKYGIEEASKDQILPFDAETLPVLGRCNVRGQE